MKKRIRQTLCLFLVAVTVLAFAPMQDMSAKKTSTKKKFTITARERANYSRNCNWYFMFSSAHKKPYGGKPYSDFSLKKYSARYVYHPKRKEVYLTFDCGYGGGQTKKILNILKRYKIKACFFVTSMFLNASPKLAKRMKKEGHLVGNHTMVHPSLAGCSNHRIIHELRGVERLMKKKTGYKLDKYFRCPYGNYSIRVLNTARRLGYETVFWSLGWNDYSSLQPSVDYVIGRFRNHYHRGMISIMHNSSTADAKALPGIIKYMRSKGYKFCRFRDRPKKKKHKKKK